MTTRIKRINTRAELAALAAELGVQRDWHEPDNQSGAELWVEISKEGKPVAEVNLATLLAMACGFEEYRWAAQSRQRLNWLLEHGLAECTPESLREQIKIIRDEQERIITDP